MDFIIDGKAGLSRIINTKLDMKDDLDFRRKVHLK